MIADKHSNIEEMCLISLQELDQSKLLWTYVIITYNIMLKSFATLDLFELAQRASLFFQEFR